ncbi:MAG TPA: Gfo/Idh/MocA family oxidoreductase [Verrucomicrobiales bacterium]|jgi:predicted dehydrogenase|nr:Gfo/Idh/MocA family oxidoreductase [Verrucomicrobiales bacterium]HIL70935.1 Gfo/Idh/MocA family oxidoreductase [Verrucomicrobiota bacterium]
MKNPIDRREFIKTSGTLSLGIGALSTVPSLQASDSAHEKIVVGVMGLGRGMAHVNAAIALPNAEVAYVCDVDTQRIDRALKTVGDKQKKPVKGVQDFRKILDDKDVDVLMIATPNFWHAPATILACSAGKHVYVEKPGSNTAAEGEMMVAAARKNKRVVQMGNQRRSWPAFIEGIQKLHDGVIGDLRYARCWYNNSRGSIGQGKPAPVPSNLDYSMWQGPVPERPYVDNLVHYNWHWRWNWGNGELGNNGIHALDVARWGLQVDLPKKVTYNGGRYHFDDDQETPDSGTAVYDYGKVGISWECSSCHRRRPEEYSFVTFYGDKGSLAFAGSGYSIYDLEGKLLEEGSGNSSTDIHVADFFNGIRNGTTPHSEIEDAQVSTLMCHLGNIGYRVGSTIHFDSDKHRIIKNRRAQKLWGKDYRNGWEPKV